MEVHKDHNVVTFNILFLCCLLASWIVEVLYVVFKTHFIWQDDINLLAFARQMETLTAQLIFTYTVNFASTAILQ